VYAIHALLRDRETLSELYKANKGKYKNLKEALIADIEALVGPMRERRNAISDEDVKKVLREGSAKARDYASKKMADVRQKIGVAI
jgi:tryptophanyl-tRNA synthetase